MKDLEKISKIHLIELSLLKVCVELKKFTYPSIQEVSLDSDDFERLAVELEDQANFLRDMK